jgi:TonB-linked SusC/RagA family outer membrane protein
MLVKSTLQRLFIASLVLLLTNIVLAQQKTITGKITDANGQPIVAATVAASGSTSATQTNSEGNFSISVPNAVRRLVITSVGFATQDVSIVGQRNISVTLATSVSELSEVVVTALGIERTKKNLQYSITTVGGENLTQAREISVANALEGRVAGVNVTKIASGPAGSSRVVIRGAKTLGSTLNQPLYVVDGVPIDNSNFGQAGVWGGADQGDGMNSINPDDIASITVLKGASAAALYGSRAANGVILITTKKGSGRRGLGIEVNSNYVFETINNLTDFQHDYGSGGYAGTTLQNQVAKAPSSLDENWNSWWSYGGWGPKFDGSPTVQFDGVTRPYSYAGDNWKRFYETGTTFTNSIALSGGSETQNFRMSAAHLDNTGVMPNSDFKRINVSLATNSKFGKKLSFNSKVLYSNEKTHNRPNLSDSPGNGFLALYYLPGDVNVLDMIGDPNKPGAVPSLEVQNEKGIRIFDGKKPGEEFQVGPNLWNQNPYWAAYVQRNDDTRDRIITTGNVRYDITDFLYISGQAGMDWFTKRGTQLTPQGTGHNRDGNMNEYEYRTREINLQYMLGFDKTFNKIGVTAFFGGNWMRRTNEYVAALGSGFNTPFFAAITNARSKNYDYWYGKLGINSLFASAEVSYNNLIFLTATGRKDWFSVLNPKSNSIEYPSIGASLVFTDALKTLPSWLSYGKVRASWAQVGNVSSVNPYQTTLLYGAGSTHIGAPLGGFVSGGNLPNADLKPFTSTEQEYGFEARFFKNRLGLDFTYYYQKTTEDILDAGISRASGFTSTTVNLGKITNKGIELLLTGKPVVGALTWDVSLNFGKNNSKVVSLIEGQNSISGEEPRTRTVRIAHIVGGPYGVITGITQLRDPATGLLVYDPDGTPLTDGTYKIIGNGVPDFTGGLNNSLTYKNVNLTFLIDFKSGGDIYSGTNVRMTQSGFTKQTLQGRAGEAPLEINGVVDDGTGTGYKPLTKTLTPGEAANYWSNLGDRAAERFIYDASFVKLRQVTLGYNLPKRFLGKTPIQNLMLSFVARNLAILYKNVDNIDPESSYTSSNSQGLDYFGFPATRTFGFNLRATF